MLKVVFQSDGYTVTTAASATEAVHVLETENFDAVLTDMKMETELAGLEVVRAARAANHEAAIVILTAFPLLAKDWRGAGANAAVSKPSNMSVLLETVRQLLRQRPSSPP